MLRVLIPLAIATGLIFLLAHIVIGVVICAVVAGYFTSLVVAPYRQCISCHGHKRHGDTLGSSALRRCWTCKGKGEYPRWGVYLFRRDVVRKIAAKEPGRNY